MANVRSMLPSETLRTAELMARSFRREPTTTYFFGCSPEERAPFLRTMFSFATRGRADTGGILVIEDKGKIVAAAITSAFEEAGWPADLEAEWDEAARGFPDGTEDRFGLYSELKKKHRPSTDHLYLVAIGVDPDHQGRGFGRMLLDEVSSLANGREVCLDTMDPQNVITYQKCGYRIAAEDILGGNPIWFMIR